MECFNHSGVQGIGICRCCGKAICKTCDIVFTKGIACSEECEKEAKDFLEIMELSKKIYGIGSYKSSRLSPSVLVWLIFSALMWIVAGFNYFSRNRIDYYSIVVATVFSFIAIIIYRNYKRMGINY